MGAPAATSLPASRAPRRLWLPKGLYETMPWIYCGLGASALLSGLFLPHPGWLAPYLLLLAVTGLHLGLWFLMLRRRYRLGRLRRQRRTASPEGQAFPDHAQM
jgi:hypothetical protein